MAPLIHVPLRHLRHIENCFSLKIISNLHGNTYICQRGKSTKRKEKNGGGPRAKGTGGSSCLFFAEQTIGMAPTSFRSALQLIPPTALWPRKPTSRLSLHRPPISIPDFKTLTASSRTQQSFKLSLCHAPSLNTGSRKLSSCHAHHPQAR